MDFNSYVSYSSMVEIHTMNFKCDILYKEIHQSLLKVLFNLKKKHHTHHIVNWRIFGWHNQSSGYLESKSNYLSLLLVHN